MVKSVVFDIGGVLVVDLWEHLFLDQNGIASRYKLPQERARAVAQDLWEVFACRSAEGDGWRELEREYWSNVIKRLRLPASINDLIELSRTFIRPIPRMTDLLERLNKQGMELAICSNNTEFWFWRQNEVLRLERFFAPHKIILSCRVGAQKKSEGLEMFYALCQVLTAEMADSVLVDDRADNIEKALRCQLPGILFPSHQNYGANYLEALLKAIEVLR
jgi:FMN phosphatase YigB (HAD superfamily)